MNNPLSTGQTPLHVAVSGGKLMAVQQLVACSGVDVHLCERRRGANCLHLAVLRQKTDCAEFLIRHVSV